MSIKFITNTLSVPIDLEVLKVIFSFATSCLSFSFVPAALIIITFIISQIFLLFVTYM